MRPEGKKPTIHLQHKAPTSPYVIDLRRPAAPVRPTQSKSTKTSIRHHVPQVVAHPPKPHEVVAIAFHPSHDLLPTHRDLRGQFTEHDHVDATHLLPFEHRARPLVDGSAADVFRTHRSSSAAEAFITLELPETDDADDDVEQTETEDQNAERVVMIHFSFPHFNLPRGWQKTIAAFIGLSFLFVLPIHAMQQAERTHTDRQAITEAGTKALAHVALGEADAKSNNFVLAQEDFAKAKAGFALAQERLNGLSADVSALLHALPSTATQLNTAKALVQAGGHLSDAAHLFTQAMEELSKDHGDSPITKLDILSLYLQQMQPLVAHAEEALAHADADVLPQDEAATVRTVASAVPLVRASIDQFLDFNKTIRVLLGGEGPMRYLVLFQNNAELRPTGGFIGSYAELTVEEGRITEMNVPGGGSYDLQGSLSDFVKAPQPLALINPRFEFQDANWFPDFPTSAKKLLTFYDHAGGPTVDGILSVNATFVGQLLALTGPVEMASYGRTITGENFLEETQKIVEIESDPALNKPKQFIADLAPKLLDRFLDTDRQDFVSLLQTVGQGLSQKEVQLYFSDPTLEQAVSDLGWNGASKTTNGDYLQIVDTNIGGGKTDLAIEEDIQVDVELEEDGSVIDTVTIKRTHTGSPSDPFSGVNNVDYLRLFVPQGSELLSASGDIEAPDASLFTPSEIPLIDDPDVLTNDQAVFVDAASGTTIGTSQGKTTFGNWVQTKPGETSTVVFRYRLPFRVVPQQGWLATLRRLAGAQNSAVYSLLLQKQSGADTRTTHVTVFPSDTLSPIWSSEESLTDQGVHYDNASDAYLASLFVAR